MKRVVSEILGGLAMTLVLFATVILLLMCSAHEVKAETWESIGTHKITFYCHCARCNGRAGQPTASGVMPERYRTAAVNPREIGLGETIYIEGFGYRVCEDTGVPVGTIDIFIPDHQLCLQYGVKWREVWIVR